MPAGSILSAGQTYKHAPHSWATRGWRTRCATASSILDSLRGCDRRDLRRAGCADKPKLNHSGRRSASRSWGLRMQQIDRDTAAKSGDFLYRYMWARRRCCRAQTPDTRLAPLIESGKREFDGIEIEPHQSPPVVQDYKHPEFFAAIIELDHMAMPDLEDLPAWRAYVLDNGALPKRPAAESAFPIRTRRGSDDPPPHGPAAA